VRLRIGVVGGGLVAQAMHLHYLAHMRDRFELVAVADPSATVRDALQQLYNLETTYSDHEQLLEDLWALGQREEPSALQATRDDEVSCAFGSRLEEDRCLDVDEPG